MASELRNPDGDLSERLAASREYWKTEGRVGAPLVMPGADLTRLDLSEQVFVEAQLQGADFRGSRLDSAQLMRAALDGAQMGGASLFKANASKASLTDVQMAGAQAPLSVWNRSTLTRSDFTGARLDKSDFSGADLIDVIFDRALVQSARFERALLLGASFKGADVTNALINGAAIESRTFTGAVGLPVGEAVLRPPVVRRPQNADERAFEERVVAVLRERGIDDVMVGFDGGPDIVIQLPGDWFAAVETSATDNRQRLFQMADRSDLIVVPDHLDVRSAMNNTPVARLRMLEQAIYELAPSRLKPYGASAVATREAARLQPYVALAQRAREDPSFISRLSVYLDTKDQYLLGEGDRRLAKNLPAHLGGNMAARGASWAERHSEELRDVISQAARIRQGAQMRTEAATELARRGWRLEKELAEATRPEN